MRVPEMNQTLSPLLDLGFLWVYRCSSWEVSGAKPWVSPLRFVASCVHGIGHWVTLDVFPSVSLSRTFHNFLILAFLVCCWLSSLHTDPLLSRPLGCCSNVHLPWTEFSCSLKPCWREKSCPPAQWAASSGSLGLFFLESGLSVRVPSSQRFSVKSFCLELSRPSLPRCLPLGLKSLITTWSCYSAFSLFKWKKK